MKRLALAYVLAGCIDIPPYRGPDAGIEVPADTIAVRVRSHDGTGASLPGTTVYFVAPTGTTMVNANAMAIATARSGPNTTVVVASTAPAKELTVITGVNPGELIEVGSPAGDNRTVRMVVTPPNLLDGQYDAVTPCGAGSGEFDNSIPMMIDAACGQKLDVLMVARREFSRVEVARWAYQQGALDTRLDATTAKVVSATPVDILWTLTPGRASGFVIAQHALLGTKRFDPLLHAPVALGATDVTTKTRIGAIALDDAHRTEVGLALASGDPARLTQRIYHRFANVEGTVTVDASDAAVAPYLDDVMFDGSTVSWMPSSSAPAQLVLVDLRGGGVRARYIMPAPSQQVGTRTQLALPTLPADVAAELAVPPAAAVQVQLYRFSGKTYDDARPSADPDAANGTFNATLGTDTFSLAIGGRN